MAKCTVTQEFFVTKEMIADAAAWKVLQDSMKSDADKKAVSSNLLPHPSYVADGPAFKKISDEVEGMPGVELWEFTAVYERFA